MGGNETMTDTDSYIEIEATFENEEQLEKYKSRLLKLREEYVGKPMNSVTKAELQYEMLRLEDYIKCYEEPGNISVELTGDVAYNFTHWSLNELLDYYKHYYPDRFEDKEIYRRIDVNNMLFDLEIKGVINGYKCVALPYSFAEKHNNKPFPEWETIGVNAKYNIKK